MPPHKVPGAPASSPALPLYNPANVHPVFFTSGWRKPPFAVPANAAFSPVATGYVFGVDAARRSSMTKL
jgi:hypothetical protein